MPIGALAHLGPLALLRPRATQRNHAPPIKISPPIGGRRPRRPDPQASEGGICQAAMIDGSKNFADERLNNDGVPR
jgi:hypothetical protein